MSNPLLRPDDPRFRKQQISQADGANPYAEGDGVLEAEADAASTRDKNSFAAPASSGGRPFVPQYEVTADHRAGLLLILTSITILASGVAWLTATSFMLVGWLLPLIGIVPSIAVVFLAADDLRTMRLGARDPAGRTLTLLALWLSAFTTITILTATGLMIYWGISILPPGFL
ncbi:hypothetical protein ETAA8_34240 [Anatilimnocola aggregata]|uniref:Uncharacterized protein n=1 Tax=Anatilimnocola aggregata TaxID=2528021 RepID=A0A517YDL5_9BACT|nr:hypothetical protein [Anatilimnocola aggregata]QDU28324.1 hypothetical protein ETAA8_34240 [Anatilimnocola aggregata]